MGRPCRCGWCVRRRPPAVALVPRAGGRAGGERSFIRPFIWKPPREGARRLPPLARRNLFPASPLPPSTACCLLPPALPTRTWHPRLTVERLRRGRAWLCPCPGLPFIPWRTACSSPNLPLAPSPPHVSCLFFSLVWVHDGRVFSFSRHRRWAWCSVTRWRAPPSLASSSPSGRASGRVGRATEVAPGRAGWTCWSGRAGVVVEACG